jgi:endoglucanase
VNVRSFLLVAVAVMSLAKAVGSSGQTSAEETGDIAAANRRLGRGINLGNALEAPNEGEWGVRLKEDYFRKIKEAGFDSVRLPVKWSSHAGTAAPYTIDPEFFDRIDWAIDQATKHKLNIIVNVHHYGEMDTNPDEHSPRLVAMWEQIGERYKGRGANLYFELLNEPHTKLVDAKWNEVAAKLLATVRKTNPTRPVIIGPPFWNGIWALDKLKLPADPNVIVTVHLYDPFEFTHQGAPWSEGSEKWKGRKWTGSDAEQAAIRKSLDQAAAWAKKHDRPIFLGEFGAYQEANLESRARWTKFVTAEAEKRGFSWSYWEFCAGFGAYDPAKDEWREPLKAALVQ